MKQNPASNTKGRKFPVEVLTDKEVLQLISRCSSRCATGIRNRALIVTLWRGMLRVSEALALKQADFGEESIRVLNGKGKKMRVVGFDPTAGAVIEKWVTHRKEKLRLNGSKPLFCTLKGNPMQPVYVRNLMKRLAAKAGVEKRVHPHGLRHTGASELLNEGMNICVISKQLGHSSIATTHRYVDHINPAEVIEAMSRREWPSPA